MAIVVPGKGWCSAVGGATARTDYGLLGPFADGDYLRRITVMITADGVTQGRFAATLGASAEASAEAFRAGSPLIQRSGAVTHTIPHFFWYGVAGVPLWFHIPVGVVGAVGARYVVWVWSAGAEAVNKWILVGAEVLRFGKGPKEVGQG